MRVETIYYLFVALMTFGIGATVTAYVPFLQSIGLSLGEVALVNVGFWIVFAGMELPTGMWADGKSRSWSLKMGVMVQLCASLCYLQASGFWSALISETALALGMAFVSGAQQAWLVETLKTQERIDELRKVFGTSAIVRALGMIIGGVFGAQLSFVDLKLIWTPYLVCSTFALVLVYRYMDGHGEPEVRLTEREALKKSWTLLLESRSLKWALVAFMLSGMMLPFNHYWSPYFIGIAGKESLSWIWPFMYLCVIPGGWLVRRFHGCERYESTVLVGALAGIGLGLCAIPLNQGMFSVMAAVAIHEMSRGALDPLMDGFVHHRVESDHRATYASLQYFIGKMGFAIVPLVVWFFIRELPDTIETISTVWIVDGAFLAIFALLLWLARPHRSF